MAVYNIHGGHNPSGKIACGASDLLDESKEDRKIAKAIIKYLKKAVAERAVRNMKQLGFTQHGDPYKTTSSLYYLNHTKAKAILFEICFVDDKDDYLLYKTVGADAIGKAIASAIVGHDIKTSVTAKVAAVFKTGAAVKIVGNAEYGGSAKGKKISSQYLNKKYIVTKVQTNNGQQEALVKQLNSWVPTKYLELVK